MEGKGRIGRVRARENAHGMLSAEKESEPGRLILWKGKFEVENIR